MFGILTSRSIDWYINESIMRGSVGGGGSRGSQGNFGGGSRIIPGHFHEMINKFLESCAQAQSIGTLVG